MDDQVQLREATVDRPHRGATMASVEKSFGAPARKHATVGQPPITRWDHPHFSVFFEKDRVIHAVATRQLNARSPPSPGAERRFDLLFEPPGDRGLLAGKLPRLPGACSQSTSRCPHCFVLRFLQPSNPSLRWHQLYGSAAALALAEAMRADPRLYVIVADGARELEQLSAELQFYSGGGTEGPGSASSAGGLDLLTFPDWEVLPYDLFSPTRTSPPNACVRCSSFRASSAACPIVTADTLMQRLPPRAYVQARAFELKVGQKLGLEAFRDRLVEAGYASVSQVTSPGEFAMRGFAARCVPDRLEGSAAYRPLR